MTIKTSDKARAMLDSIVAKMENGDLSPLVAVARVHLDDSCPASHWTYSNRLLAYLQTGQLDCRGYNQWRTVGRHVKKGSVAAYIIAPRFVRSKTEVDENGKPKIAWTYFATIPVFPLDTTDGDDIEYPGTPVEPMPLADLATKLGIEVSYEPLARALGAVNQTGTKIRMGSSDPAPWFHELAHAIGARLHGRLQGGQHEYQEVPAELAAAVLMEVYGLGDRTGNCWVYIKEYAKDPVEAIHRAAARVGEILDFVFKTERGEGDGKAE